MIGLEDRQALAQDIEAAHAGGARLQPACEIAGIDVRTLQRWKAQAGLTAGDGRPHAARPLPSHALSPAERAALLAVANAPRFASVPPARIVPMLADEGVYLGSESSMARVLKCDDAKAVLQRSQRPRRQRRCGLEARANFGLKLRARAVAGFLQRVALDLGRVGWHLALHRAGRSRRSGGARNACGSCRATDQKAPSRIGRAFGVESGCRGLVFRQMAPIRSRIGLWPKCRGSSLLLRYLGRHSGMPW